MLVFGIRLPSFFVVGDLLLLLLSLSMVQAHISPKRKTPEKDKVERPIGGVTFGRPPLADLETITHVIFAANATPGGIAHQTMSALFAISAWLSVRLTLALFAQKISATDIQIHHVTRLMVLIIAGIQIGMMVSGPSMLFPGGLFG